MPTDSKSLTIQKVHSILRRGGCEKSRWIASKRIRGSGRTTEGYSLQKTSPPGTFILRYVCGDWYVAAEASRAAFAKYRALLEDAGLTLRDADHGIYISHTASSDAS